jgi:hypothetical protein
MIRELERYKLHLVQELAVLAAYMNPQIPKVTDPGSLAILKTTVRSILQRRYDEAYNLGPLRIRVMLPISRCLALCLVKKKVQNAMA